MGGVSSVSQHAHMRAGGEPDEKKHLRLVAARCEEKIKVHEGMHSIYRSREVGEGSREEM